MAEIKDKTLVLQYGGKAISNIYMTLGGDEVDILNTSDALWYRNLEIKEVWFGNHQIYPKNDIMLGVTMDNAPRWISYIDGSVHLIPFYPDGPPDGFVSLTENPYPEAKEIYLPDICYSDIGVSAFENSRLRVIRLPRYFDKIQDRAFANSQIERIMRIWYVESLGVEAFVGCKNLDSIYLTESLNSIGRNCFKDSALKTVFYDRKRGELERLKDLLRNSGFIGWNYIDYVKVSNLPYNDYPD